MDARLIDSEAQCTRAIKTTKELEQKLHETEEKHARLTTELNHAEVQHLQDRTTLLAELESLRETNKALVLEVYILI